MPGTLTQDLCYAARQLRANPGFAAAAVLSLALGVGANSAIFQLVDAVRLRTLPVTNPQDLAMAAVNPSMRRSGCRPKAAAKMLFGLKPNDAATFVAASVLLAVATAAAGSSPRAARRGWIRWTHSAWSESEVGQTVRLLSSVAQGRQSDRRQKAIVCPTVRAPARMAS